MRFAVAAAALAESLTLAAPLADEWASTTSQSVFATLGENKARFDQLRGPRLLHGSDETRRRLDRRWGRRRLVVASSADGAETGPPVATGSALSTHPMKLRTTPTSEGPARQGMAAECDPKSYAAPDVGVLSCGQVGYYYCKESDTSSLGGICEYDARARRADSLGNDKRRATGILRNARRRQKQSRHQAPLPATECDPTSSAVHADVGILNCGIDGYCREDDASSKGGICVSPPQQGGEDRGRRTRRLQDETETVFESLTALCNNTNYTCTSCNFDEEAYTAEFDCEYAVPDCTSVPDYYCNTNATKAYCTSAAVSGSLAGYSYSYQRCVTYSDATDFKYCTAYVTPVGDADVGTCEISVDDVVCNSCTVLPGPDDQEACFEFDCTNTKVGVTGNDCDFTFSDAIMYEIQYLHLPCEGGCSLCQAGEVMGSPELNVTLDTEKGVTVPCRDLQLAALTGYDIFESSTYCSILNPIVSIPCNCYNPLVPNKPTDPTDPTAAPTSEEPLSFVDYIGVVCSDGMTDYNCSSCEFDEEAGTGSLACTLSRECNDVPSLCNDNINMCTTRTLSGSAQSADVYSYEYCSSFTPPFDFSFCISYSYAADADATCEMKVNNITCKSCSVETDPTAEGETCAVFDCGNTVIGYAARLCEVDLMETTEIYFVYQALPCEGGCNLCVDGVMVNGAGSFMYGGEEMNCIETQFKASIGPSRAAYCSALQAIADEPCGCVAPPTQAPTALPTSSGIASTTVSAIGALSFAGLSLVAFIMVR